MLKMTLVKGETINIGENIQIQLASDTVYRANILIDAPREINIERTQTDAADGGSARPEQSEVQYKTPKSRISIVDNRRRKKENG